MKEKVDLEELKKDINIYENAIARLGDSTPFQNVLTEHKRMLGYMKALYKLLSGKK